MMVWGSCRTLHNIPPSTNNNIKIWSQWVSSLSFWYFGKLCLGQMPPVACLALSCVLSTHLGGVTHSQQCFICLSLLSLVWSSKSWKLLNIFLFWICFHILDQPTVIMICSKSDIICYILYIVIHILNTLLGYKVGQNFYYYFKSLEILFMKWNSWS